MLCRIRCSQLPNSFDYFYTKRVSNIFTGISTTYKVSKALIFRCTYRSSKQIFVLSNAQHHFPRPFLVTLSARGSRCNGSYRLMRTQYPDYTVKRLEREFEPAETRKTPLHCNAQTERTAVQFPFNDAHLLCSKYEWRQNEQQDVDKQEEFEALRQQKQRIQNYRSCQE